jgi:hypothetical protein
MRWESCDGDRTHRNKLDTFLFTSYLPFFRKVKFIFVVFRVIQSFMDGTVKEQRFRTKKVNAKKVNTAKTQADWSCKNLLTQFSHVLHLHAAVFTIY